MEQLKSFAWHQQKKFLNPLELDPFMDLDFGFLALVASMQMEMQDQKRKSMEVENLTFSASLPQNLDLLTSRIAPCLPNPSQAEYFALWVYHLLEANELVEERIRHSNTRQQQPNDQEHAANIRRVFEQNEEGHAHPIGDVIHLPGRQPESRLDRYLKRPPESNYVFDSSYPWFNNPYARGNQLPNDVRMFTSCPSMDYIARTCERVYNLRRSRGNREQVMMSCAQFWRLKRREMDEGMLPEKRRKLRAIKKKQHIECEMELASDLRQHFEMERYNDMYERGHGPPNKHANCGPIGDKVSYSGRCLPQPNQLRLCEIQICPSISKAREVDEKHTSDTVLKEQPPMVFLLSQFMEREKVSDTEKTHSFPQYFETEGDEKRYIKSCDLIVYRNDELIPKDLGRFSNDFEAYDDLIGLDNFQMAPINPTDRRKFRYS